MWTAVPSKWVYLVQFGISEKMLKDQLLTAQE
jgi:hypothetical protein